MPPEQAVALSRGSLLLGQLAGHVDEYQPPDDRDTVHLAKQPRQLYPAGLTDGRATPRPAPASVFRILPQMPAIPTSLDACPAVASRTSRCRSASARKACASRVRTST